MLFGKYMRVETVKDIESIDGKPDILFIGDPGCPYFLQDINKVIEFLEFSKSLNMDLHYISPKLTNNDFDLEYQKLKLLMAYNVRITINDYGMLHNIRHSIKKESKVYIGNTLTKSIRDLVWSSVFFRDEKHTAIDYLSRNNYTDSIKIKFIKDCGISGIEVFVDSMSEDGLEYVISNGLEVIGYCGYKIAAISRICPCLHIHQRSYGYECQTLCKKPYTIKAADKASELYPELILAGSVLYYENKQKTYDISKYSVIVEMII